MHTWENALSLLTWMLAYSYVPGISSMEHDLHITNHELSLLGIAVYSLGFSLPPMVLAPFSEVGRLDNMIEASRLTSSLFQVYGRNSLYLITHFAYTMLFIGTGYARNISTVIVLRFLSGAFGSTGSTMVGGTIAGGCTSSLPGCRRHYRSLASFRHVVI